MNPLNELIKAACRWPYVTPISVAWSLMGDHVPMENTPFESGERTRIITNLPKIFWNYEEAKRIR